METLIFWTIIAGTGIAVVDIFFVRILRLKIKSVKEDALKFPLIAAAWSLLTYGIWIGVGVYLIHTLATEEIISWPNLKGAAFYLIASYAIQIILGGMLGTFKSLR